MRTLLVSLMGILAPALLVGAQAAFGQDNCSDILQHGIYEEFRTSLDTISNKVVQSQYCSQSSQSSSDDQGINLDSLSQNGQFQGAWSSRSSEEKRQVYCDSRLDKDFDSKSLLEFSRVASKAIVTAWRRCMDGKGVRFSYEQSADRKSVRLVAKDTTQGGDGLQFSSTKLKDQVSILPPGALECDEAFKRQPESSIVCRRLDLTQPVSVKLTVTRGEHPSVLLSGPRVASDETVIKPPAALAPTFKGLSDILPGQPPKCLRRRREDVG